MGVPWVFKTLLQPCAELNGGPRKIFSRSHTMNEAFLGKGSLLK